MICNFCTKKAFLNLFQVALTFANSLKIIRAYTPRMMMRANPESTADAAVWSAGDWSL